MWIMTEHGWRLLTCASAIPAPTIENKDSHTVSSRYQDKYNAMSFEDKYIELARLVLPNKYNRM